MAAQDEAVTLLRYRVDNASVTQAVQANQKVETSVRQVNAAAGAIRFNSVAEAQAALGVSAAQLGVTESVVTTELQRQLPLAERLAEAAKVRASAEQGTVAGLRSDAFGAAGGGNQQLQRQLFSARQAAIALPGVGYQSPLTVGIRGAEILVEKTGASLTQLGLAAGIAAPAVIAVAIAFDQVSKSIENSKKVLTGALSAQSNYYDALENLTTTEVNERIAQLERTRPFLEQQIAETQNALDSAFAQAQAEFGDPAARALDAAGKLPTAQLREQLDELNAEFQNNVQTTARLTQGVKEFAFEANDAAAAAELFAQQLEEATAPTTRRILSVAQTVVEAEKQTSKERQQAADELKLEILVLERFRDTTPQTAESLEELNTQIETARAKLDAYAGTFSDYADLLELEAQRKETLKDQYDDYLALVDQEIELREEAFDIQQKILDIEAERDDKLQELAQDRSERIADIELEAGERREELAQDHADRIYKINRDAARDLQTAVGNRDALAFSQAQIRQKDALEDQQKALDKSLKQVNKNLDKQERALEKSYRKQVDNVTESANRQLLIQRRALAETEFAIATSVNSQRFMVESGFDAMVGSTTNGMLTLQNVISTAWTNIIGSVVGIYNSAIGGGSAFPPLVGGGGGGGSTQRVTAIAENAARDYMYRQFTGARVLVP